MKYPKDRFDDIPASLDRRGAHRAPRTRGDKIASWLWGLGAVVVLVVIGLVGMFVIDNVVSFNDAAPEETTTETAAPETTEPQDVQPALDPNVQVTVLNGTDLAGVAGGNADTLSSLGWNVTVIDDADRADYSQTTIYYGDAANEGAALQVAQDVGGGTPTLDPNVAPPGTITIIIGYDLAEG
ncbi:MAG: LytR C-terminal domain-containing protein [Pseudoclavibacter sp.]